MIRVMIFLVSYIVLTSLSVQAECQKDRVKLQVLGSGGPELTDKRASTSYLVWLDEKAIILVDTGSGSALNFEKTKAELNDLEMVVFSHLHVDHSADFPAFIKAFYFSQRNTDLWVFGPSGNHLMPATTEFVNGFLGKKGIYRYLSEYVNPDSDSRYKIRFKNVDIHNRITQSVYQTEELTLSAIPVHHGSLPALAWRVNLAGCALVFSGDMNNEFKTFTILANNADLMIAHNAIPEGTKGGGRSLHMPPSEIGKIAAQTAAKKLILSHRMMRTLKRGKQTRNIIRRYYQGPVLFANDLDIFIP